MRYLLFFLLLLLGPTASAQRYTARELTAAILRTDSLMFDAYNACDTARFRRFLASDLEFYHDQGGLMRGADSTVLALQRNLCSNADLRIYRQAVPGSLQVFPIQHYGAILSGQHYFYHITQNGARMTLEGIARFTHLFKQEGETFRATRILSYDHQPVGQDDAPVRTFLTWNIRFDNPNDGPDRWELRREALAAEVLRLRPAVAGFQEVLARQVQFLEEKLPGYRRVGVGRDDGREQGEFSPIFFDTTVFRLLEGRTLWLSPTPDVPSRGWDAALPRIATLVVLQDKHSGDSLWVVNTHFDHIGKEARLRSAGLLANTLQPALDARVKVVLLGDLNAEPTDPPIQLLKQRLNEACPDIKPELGTFNGFDVQRTTFPRIDYVFFSSPGWTALRYEVLRPLVNGRHVSDHFPVLVQLR